MARRLLRKILAVGAFWGIIVFSLRCLHFFGRDKIEPGRPGQASLPNLSKSPQPSSIPLEPVQRRIQSLRETPPVSNIASTLLDGILAGISAIQPESLTAIMPLSAASLVHLNETLSPLLFKTSCLQQLILVCPEDILQQARKATRQIIYSISLEASYPELLVRPYRPQAQHETTPTLYVISEILTDWILVLDENGLNAVNSQARQLLLNPSSFRLPVGPKCDDYCHFVADELHLSSFSLRTQGSYYTPVKALVPPFVISTALLKDQVDSLNGKVNSWQHLGLFVASRERNGMGGLLMSSTEDDMLHQIQTTGPFISESTAGKDETSQSKLNNVDTAAHKHHFSSLGKTEKNTRSGLVAIILPSYNDLSAFSRAACELKKKNDLFLRILLYSHVTPLASEHKQSKHRHGTCLLDYDYIAPEDDKNVAQSGSLSILVQQWLETLEILPGVIITIDAIEISHVTTSPLIILPSEDLIFCEWVGSLSLLELFNWHSPRFTVSIITKDRPQSLNRLLSSITSAKYYGDRIPVRLNMEQSSDEDTQALVRSFQWSHGEVFVHRRVIHAGLLPAVVESWYPHTDDEYGILLEDDVEVSPMFYAWAKMAVLRYRYGSFENRSPRLFGVSLYQQKALELRQEGRIVFDAKAVLHKEGLYHVTTPYLSSIPCSWGAVYFPEHWREFHDYLAIRLSEYAFSLEEDIVPNVRSNQWSKSWKKFFIELAYLRGYVMIYPNYPHHVSLTTNHLEVGAHVKEMPLDIYQQRKAMFSVPLMQLPVATDPPSSTSSSTSLSAAISSVGILELPDRTLPQWREMPVLDFGGGVSSLDDLMEAGLARRALLSGCAGVESWQLEGTFDILDLLCIQRAT